MIHNLAKLRIEVGMSPIQVKPSSCSMSGLKFHDEGFCINNKITILILMEINNVVLLKVENANCKLN